jgi:mannose-6-phosphate isomerase-like protein (cupin superfamily)
MVLACHPQTAPDVMQVNSVSRATAERYGWGNNCDGWHLLKDADLSVIEEQMPPGTSEVMHCHHQAQQFFYVLSGRCVMEIGTRRSISPSVKACTFRPESAVKSGASQQSRSGFW